MRNLLLVATAVGVVVGGVQTAGAGAPLPTNPFHYAIFALDRVTLGQGAQVDRGDVGVNSSSGEVQMRYRARIAGNAGANTIAPGRNARVAGTMFCNTGPAGSPGCSAITLPLVDTALLPIVNVEAGNDDVKLGANLSSSLAPGKYGKVKLAQKSRLLLASGTYAFRSLTLNRGASLLCDGTCVIGVDDEVQVGDLATISTTTSPADATKLRIEVEFGGARRASFRAYWKSKVDATVYAPNGSIRLGTNGRFTGSFVAREVEVHNRSRVLSEPQP
jgi:hypothetical protein